MRQDYNINVEDWDKATIDLESLKSDMDESFKHGKPKGELTHFAGIDKERILSWKRGFLYCFTGNPGSGKSEFLNTLSLLKSLRDNWKWAVYSPESYPAMDLVDTLIHTLAGKSTDPDHTNQMSKKEYDKCFEFVKKHYSLLDFKEMPTVKDVLKEAIKNNIDGVIIDPFNSLDDQGKTFYEFLKTELTYCKQFARENDIVVILVEHPHSANSLDEHGNPKEPSEYTLSGGKMWHNKCDVIGVVHRPLVHSDPVSTKVTFRTRKVKNQKLNGFPGCVEMNFDRLKNRYYVRDEKGNEINGFDKKLKKIEYDGYDQEAGF